MRLVSLAIKTAGLNNGGGYGTPAQHADVLPEHLFD